MSAAIITYAQDDIISQLLCKYLNRNSMDTKMYIDDAVLCKVPAQPDIIIIHLISANENAVTDFINTELEREKCAENKYRHKHKFIVYSERIGHKCIFEKLYRDHGDSIIFMMIPFEFEYVIRIIEWLRENEN